MKSQAYSCVAGICFTLTAVPFAVGAEANAAGVFAAPASGLTDEARSDYFKNKAIGAAEALIKSRRLEDSARPLPPEAAVKNLRLAFGRANGAYGRHSDLFMRSRMRGDGLAAYLAAIYRAPIAAADADLFAADALAEVAYADMAAVAQCFSRITPNDTVRATRSLDPICREALREIAAHKVAEARRARERPQEPETPAPYPPGVGVSASAGAKSGDSLFRKKDYAGAFDTFSRRAASGDAYAMFRLGELHRAGRGVAVDEAKARDCFGAAAAAGNTRALLLLAELFATGSSGFAKDAETARRYREAAAVLEYADRRALRSDAVIVAARGYLENLEAPGAGERALFWLDRAAGRSDSRALFMRGALYFSGASGVPADPVRARADLVAASRSLYTLSRDAVLCRRFIAEIDAGRTGREVYAAVVKEPFEEARRRVTSARIEGEATELKWTATNADLVENIRPASRPHLTFSAAPGDLRKNLSGYWAVEMTLDNKRESMILGFDNITASGATALWSFTDPAQTAPVRLSAIIGAPAGVPRAGVSFSSTNGALSFEGTYDASGSMSGTVSLRVVTTLGGVTEDGLRRGAYKEIVNGRHVRLGPVYREGNVYKASSYRPAGRWTATRRVDWDYAAAGKRDMQEYDPSAAIHHFGEALKIKDEISHRFDRGTAYYEARRHPESITEFNACLAANPKYTRALFNRMLARRHGGRLAEALTDTDELLAWKHDYQGIKPADVRFIRADILWLLDRVPEANAEYDAALASDPKLKSRRRVAETREGYFKTMAETSRILNETNAAMAKSARVLKESNDALKKIGEAPRPSDGTAGAGKDEPAELEDASAASRVAAPEPE